jgi:hypothetical protein
LTIKKAMKITDWPNKQGLNVGPHDVHFLAGGEWGVRVIKAGRGWKWRRFDPGDIAILNYSPVEAIRLTKRFGHPCE